MVAIYREALVSDPLSTSVLNNLAGIYYLQSRFTEFAEILDRMEQVDAESAFYKYMVGLQQVSLGNLEEAVRLFLALGGALGDWGLAVAY